MKLSELLREANDSWPAVKQGKARQNYLAGRTECPNCGNPREKSKFKFVKTAGGREEMCDVCQQEYKEEKL